MSNKVVLVSYSERRAFPPQRSSLMSNFSKKSFALPSDFIERKTIQLCSSAMMKNLASSLTPRRMQYLRIKPNS